MKFYKKFLFKTIEYIYKFFYLFSLIKKNRVKSQTLTFLMLFLLLVSNASAVLNTFYRVNPDNTVNIKGNYAVVGNTVMCLTEKESGYGGTCQDGNDYLTITSNMHVSKYLDIDDDNDTWDSTSSYINLPVSYDASDLTNTKKGVIWAGLFWQGRISDDKDYVMHYGVEDSSGGYHFVEIGSGSSNSLPSDLKTIGADKIKLKVDNASYADITASTFYTYSSSNGTTYAAFADVTNIVRPLITASGKHIFTVANLTTNEGREATPGVFGGWSLVVIYAEDYRGDMRNISVYNGFDIVDDPSQAFTITNFILPKENDVNASLSLFSGEGEYRYGYRPGNTWAYDWVKISPDGTNYDYMPVPSNLDNRNIFDGRFSGVLRDHIDGEYNDLQVNNDGVDVDTYDVSDIMTQYRDANPNLNTLYIQWASNNDYITPSMLVFATQIYEPKFCYDYAYKQYGRYFTEENDGTHYPRLTGNVFPDEPIDMKIYLRNQIASDLMIENMRLNVVDINTSQAIYDTNNDSVKIAKVGESIPQTIYNSELNVSDNYIKNIPAGDMGANDYVYLYYSLKPINSSLDMPIGIEASYNLVLSTDVNISYDLRLGPDIPLCSSANFNYTPAKGIFSVVHSDYYDNGSYYNLPTQVVDRVGNFFKIISFDPDNLDTPKEVNGTVKTFVEIIDASAFHDVNASCQELSSTVTGRVEVDFNSTNSVSLNGINFFGTALQNAAFRVSYNTNPDGNLLEWHSDDGNVTFYITNFPNIAQLGECKSGNVNFTDTHGNEFSTNQSAVACGNANSGNGNAGISESQKNACERCIYGYYTKMLCSRDNFAIRPEAFLIKLNDQNQTTGSSELRIADDISGIPNPSGNIVDLAAGYNYDIEINATNFIDNNATPGYTAFYNNVTNNQYIRLKWEPRTTVSNCNDTNDTNLSMNLYNGKLINLHDQNITINNVGEYRLTMFDSLWTHVDWDTTYMAHHTGSHFKPGSDCITGSDIVPTGSSGSATPAVGCDVTSDHNATSGIKYRDYNITFHPYKFDLGGILPTVGLNFTTATTGSFVYMANINQSSDENMSYHLNGKVIPKGANDNILSNFVNKCYAVPLDINISTSNRDLNDSNGNHVNFLARFHDINSSDKVITILDINKTDNGSTSHTADILFQTEQNTTIGYFPKDLNGTMQTRLNMNYTRVKTTTVNPKSLTFIKYRVNCKNPSTDCTFSADFDNNKTTKGSKDLNQTIYFYYGRIHAPDYSSDSNIINNATIYYEAYCKDCNKSLYSSLGAESVNDVYWYINNDHNSTNYGYISGFVQPNTKLNFTPGSSSVINNGKEIYTIKYTGSTYPYRERVDMNASSWLIFNPYDANASVSSFFVEFSKYNDWAGVGNTGKTVDLNISSKSSKRIEW